MLNLRDMHNFGRTHIFLGDTAAEDVDKTTVEEGCSFSPGLWTFGISVAADTGKAIIAPQTGAMSFSFENAHPPIVKSCYNKDGLSIQNTITRLDSIDYYASKVEGAKDAAVVISDWGPAGGVIREITVDEDRNEITVKGGEFGYTVVLRFETPFSAQIYPSDETHESPFCLVHFENEARFAAIHSVYYTALYSSALTPNVLPVTEAFVQSRIRFEKALPARVYAPDKRIANTWEQCAFHILNAIEVGVPRIGVANYPIFWIRDCVMVLKVLDLIGRGDLCEGACDVLAPWIFSGGFGCEADNPGEGIWALVNHYTIAKDIDWLRKVYPEIQKRVAWIDKMLAAKEPIRMAGNNRTIMSESNVGFSLVCMAAEGNHIHGRMDGHFPDFYINCWAYAGLASAAAAAEALGDNQNANLYRAKAQKLDDALYTELLPLFGNERDSCVAPFPTGALSSHTGELAQALDTWYSTHRLDKDNKRIPEIDWTYFEACQMHNMMLLGKKEKAWINLDGMLDEQRLTGMSIFTEGQYAHTEMLPFGNGLNRRGWLQEGAYAANMPHNWTTAEMMLLIRDIFVVDEEEGLLLCQGVPKSWNLPGAVYGVSDFPTKFGTFSFRVEVDANGKRNIIVEKGTDIPYRLAEE